MKRGRNWEIRSASGTRMPMVRPTGLKGFLPTVSADSERMRSCVQLLQGHSEHEMGCALCGPVLQTRWWPSL